MATFATAVLEQFTVWAERSGTAGAAADPAKQAAVDLGVQFAEERWGSQDDDSDLLVVLDAFLKSLEILHTLTTVELTTDDQKWLDGLKVQRDELKKMRQAAEFLPFQKTRQDAAIDAAFPYTDD